MGEPGGAPGTPAKRSRPGSTPDGADDTVRVLERIVERRGRAPKLIRCDNGPEFISQSLRDWCRFNKTIAPCPIAVRC
jgi:Integrase core domain